MPGFQYCFIVVGLRRVLFGFSRGIVGVLFDENSFSSNKSAYTLLKPQRNTNETAVIVPSEKHLLTGLRTRQSRLPINKNLYLTVTTNYSIFPARLYCL